jgi:hypothetical protein
MNSTSSSIVKGKRDELRALIDPATLEGEGKH